MVLTAEGTAPYAGQNLGMAFARANRAVRVLELRVTNVAQPDCKNYTGQEGNAASGAGFNACTTLGDNIGDLGGVTIEGMSAGGGMGTGDEFTGAGVAY